jgi:hypothetical protein
VSGSPRTRLQRVADGQEPLRLDDLQGLLADHILQADVHVRGLGEQLAALLEMLLGAQARGPADPGAILDLVGRLEAIYQGRNAQLRRTVELLHAISKPTFPAVKVIAAEVGQVNVAAQQVASVSLGGRQPPR